MFKHELEFIIEADSAWASWSASSSLLADRRPVDASVLPFRLITAVTDWESERSGPPPGVMVVTGADSWSCCDTASALACSSERSDAWSRSESVVTNIQPPRETAAAVANMMTMAKR